MRRLHFLVIHAQLSHVVHFTQRPLQHALHTATSIASWCRNRLTANVQCVHQRAMPPPPTKTHVPMSSLASPVALLLLSSQRPLPQSHTPFGACVMSAPLFRVRPPGCFTKTSMTTPIVPALTCKGRGGRKMEALTGSTSGSSAASTILSSRARWTFKRAATTGFLLNANAEPPTDVNHAVVPSTSSEHEPLPPSFLRPLPRALVGVKESRQAARCCARAHSRRHHHLHRTRRHVRGRHCRRNRSKRE